MNLLYFFIFIFGAIIGSFLNCLIYRLEKDQSMWGRSYCPHCRHTLAWFDLIPVVSFIWLLGKCRYCHQKISFQYPLVEIITGALFLFIFHQWQGFEWAQILWLWYLTASLLVIFVYDLKFFLIPDKVLFPAILVALLYHMSFGYILAAMLASGFFLALFLVSKGNWMGFGDVKLAILLGLLLGWPNILVGMFLSFLFGAIIGIILMILPKPKITLKSQLPFAPFLITGTFVALFWSSQLIEFYQSFFLL